MVARGDIEVGAERDAAGDARDRRQVASWLLACCALVFVMVVLGGATRLTGSGLSMAGWEPLHGIVPPLDAAGWQEEFDRYRETPQFRHANYWMGVEDFKEIFWLEYIHRALGRLIGAVFFVPMIYFLVRGKVTRAMVPRLVAVFVLGGLQGLLGWYMVKSGLVDDPRVSQYRLTAHLGAAVAIYAYMFWVALGLLRDGAAPRHGAAGRGLCRATGLLAGGVALTLVSGGFVAGLHAGMIFNTFPMMGDHWIPPGMYAMEPALRNWFENVATVQFNHRVLAMTMLVAVLSCWAVARRRETGRAVMRWLDAAAAMVVVQVGLGIATLLLQVPVAVAVVHQGGALVLLTLVLGAWHAQTPAREGRP